MGEPDFDFVDAAQFLPKLPRSNLDDRTFEDLVQECLLRIPRYCPEWTNYNPGDPGVTLIELFSWLVHQMLFRFNQVPRRNYVAFLELLGIRLQPPTPALTDMTFYLTKEQSVPIHILAGTEVATVRTENQAAIVFSTTADLAIGIPLIKHVLLGESALSFSPGDLRLHNPFVDTRYEQTQQWQVLERDLPLFADCQPGCCAYFVLDAVPMKTAAGRSGIEGNVLAFTFRGPKAVTTGINPMRPPLRWEAWNGEAWVGGILRSHGDDHTKGFSFDKLSLEAGPNPEREGADVLLHLPQVWPRVADETGREGHWIRCVYTEPESESQQYPYQRSPVISGLGVRSLGGAIGASECVQVTNEFLGVSNGKPGQVFQLEGRPILAREPGESLEILLPGGIRQDWHEVSDFGDAGPDDLCYMVDSLSGQLQFGPLIREPYQIKQQTHERGQIQSWGRGRPALNENHLPSLPAVLEDEDRRDERQYGAIPPLGSEIYMRRYRIGGGSRGNVRAKSLTVLKTAIPYVKQVINYAPAQGGSDAESLDQAVLRAPSILRSRKVAITPTDFEETAKRFRGDRFIHRAHCITDPELTVPGQIRLLVVPGANDISGDMPGDMSGNVSVPVDNSLSSKERLEKGIHPDRLSISTAFASEVKQFIDQHRALGIQVKLETPKYVGIQVVAEVYLQPQYDRTDSYERINDRLRSVLYQFLNPLKSSYFGEQGWPLGRAVRVSDAIALLQEQPEVKYVGAVSLYSLREYDQGDGKVWIKEKATGDEIALSALETVCSWEDVSAVNQSPNQSLDQRSNQSSNQGLEQETVGHTIRIIGQ